MMPLLLVGISFCALFVYLQSTSDRSSLRETFLKTSLSHGLLIVCSTEGMSFFRILHEQAILALWSFIACGIVLTVFWKQQHQSLKFSLFFQTLLRSLVPEKTLDRFCALGIALLLALNLFVALSVPPNNPDAMAYHMPRVMHWIQNRHVEHYPTADLRQISFPPGASYLVLHVYLLSDSDRFAPAVQWFAYLGCILGISLLASFVGCSSWKCALLGASVPMAVLQSSTLQNDLVTSFWLIASACFLFRHKSYARSDLCWFTLALSLAILTKPTAILFGFPMGLLLVIRLLFFSPFADTISPKKIFLKKMTILLLVGCGSFSLSIPHFLRNQETFGHFLGPDTGTRTTQIALKPMVSNITKNLCLNLPIPQVWSLCEYVHQHWLSFSQNDPSCTYEKNTFHPVLIQTTLIPHEDFVGCFFHLLLLGYALVFLLISFPQEDFSNRIQLGLVGVAGFSLFCLLLKWQDWGNRLLLPLVLLQTPLMTLALKKETLRSFSFALILLLTLLALFYGLTSVHHPILALPSSWTNTSQSPSILTLSREDIYFSGHSKQIRQGFTDFVEQVIQNKIQFIGIQMSFGEWEYGIWALLKNRGYPHFRLKHIQVQNESSRHPPEFPDHVPCAVLNIVPLEPK